MKPKIDSNTLSAASSLAGLIPGVGGVLSAGIGILGGEMAADEQEQLAAEERAKLNAMESANSAYKNMINANAAAKNTPNSPLLFRDGGSIAEAIGQEHKQGGTPYKGVEIEKKEMVYNENFVFSDQLNPFKSPDSFARHAKKIKDKFKKRINDPVEREEMKRQLNELAALQEHQKIIKGVPPVEQGTGMPEQVKQMRWGGSVDEVDPFLIGDESYKKRNYSTDFDAVLEEQQNQINLGSPMDPAKELQKAINYANTQKQLPVNTQATNPNVSAWTKSTIDNSMHPNITDIPIEELNVSNELFAGIKDSNIQPLLGFNVNKGVTSTNTISPLRSSEAGTQSITDTKVVDGTVDKKDGKVYTSSTPEGSDVGKFIKLGLGNFYDFGRSFEAEDEVYGKINFEEKLVEPTQVDLDLIDPERAIAESQKVFGANQYNIAQNARGQGNMMANSLANAELSAKQVSDTVNQANAANVAIHNEQEKINAQTSIQNSDNVLRALIFNQEQDNKSLEASMANRGIAANMASEALHGTADVFNVLMQDRQTDIMNDVQSDLINTSDKTEAEKIEMRNNFDTANRMKHLRTEQERIAAKAERKAKMDARKKAQADKIAGKR